LVACTRRGGEEVDVETRAVDFVFFDREEVESSVPNPRRRLSGDQLFRGLHRLLPLPWANITTREPCEGRWKGFLRA
jgi:hypothetical protein